MYRRSAARPVQINAAQLPNIEALEKAIAQLSNRDRDFAGDLLTNFRRWGSLSDKQMHWVDTLTQRATAPKAAPVAAVTVDVQRIQELFDRAAQKLRRVKVGLQDAEGNPVVFARAGQQSKYAGQVLLTDGKPFGQNKFYGRIDVDGKFYPTRYAGPTVVALVTEFAADPEAVAGRYGRLTGACCFCAHGLKDDRSLEVGYGPICADRFGLNWG